MGMQSADIWEELEGILGDSGSSWSAFLWEWLPYFVIGALVLSLVTLILAIVAIRQIGTLRRRLDSQRSSIVQPAQAPLSAMPAPPVVPLSAAQPAVMPTMPSPPPAQPIAPSPFQPPIQPPAPEQATGAFCRQCGQTLRPGLAFCPNCGTAT